MIDKKNRFVISAYDTKSAFSSFLPGISGIYGIPIWCYYVNRGQCVTSFGIQDKDHSIMEFYPAHQAYQRTKRMGFRTLLKVDGEYHECFSDVAVQKNMHIGMNELVIEEMDDSTQLQTTVRYYTLPSERIGGLVREVTITNRSSQYKNIELADGMAEMIPFGVNLASMKDMAQTSQAWMEVEDHEDGIPYCKVRVSMEDTAEVRQITGGHFGFAYDDDGCKLPVIVSQDTLFGCDTSLEYPCEFVRNNVQTLLSKKQQTQNHLPCCFFVKEQQLCPQESMTLREVYGASERKELLHAVVEKAADRQYFHEKYREAVMLTEELTACIGTKTGNLVFDRYCRQTYLDNVLRGGYPLTLGNHKLFYVYSRKHGDIERDYNFFRMQPEFFSQGNGNFRDVNQNRRSDALFSINVTDQNIHMFYDCIQMNGYNPLGIEKLTYHMPGEKSSFTPGEKYVELLQTYGEDREKTENAFQRIMTAAIAEQRTDFIEGYWSDHWTYNLDLVESYLSVYPEMEETLLFMDDTYRYKQGAAKILPHNERYVKTEQGIRQYHYLEKTDADNMYTLDGDGKEVTATLFEKIYLLCVTKMAALDCYGMGIEMEGGKPGWYDALNGLPGILGASMCETYELKRNLDFLINLLEKYEHVTQVYMIDELFELATGIEKNIHINQKKFEEDAALMGYWCAVNDQKELYWTKTCGSISGLKTAVSTTQLRTQLQLFADITALGIKKALAYGKGIAPAYFYYEVTDYKEESGKIIPTGMQVRQMPYFLEGPVRFFKLDVGETEKKQQYDRIRNSQLFDAKLQMYKVNASLKDAVFEIGRCKAFTPGWLENESIWLHMAYKYLLVLLKSGLYEAYLVDFEKGAIPFLDEMMYGRSLFENSSFLASSENPDEKIHGKGFVSRLSGSTAEFLELWQIMMFGKQPFHYENGQLTLTFTPLIPAYLIGESQTIEAVFRGCIPVVYHLTEKQHYIPGTYGIADGRINLDEGQWEPFEGTIAGEMAERIRSGHVKSIELTLSIL